MVAGEIGESVAQGFAVAKVRPSSQPRFWECASSAGVPVTQCDSESLPSKLGNAVHEYADNMFGAAVNDLSALARKHDVLGEIDELEFLCRNVGRAWDTLAPYFPDAKAEVALSSVLTEGTADFLSHDGKTAAVGDWKTGRVERNYRRQLMAYAYALRAERGMPASGEIVAVVVWVRLGTFDVERFTDTDLDDFRAGVVARSKDIGRVYNPGESCVYCPMRLECPARQSYLNASAGLLESMSPRAMTPADMGALYSRAKMLGAALDDYHGALKMLLKEGPVETGHGTVLQLKDVERDTIDPQRAWPVLTGLGLNDEDLARCVKMGKGALMDVVGERAEKGMKGKRRAMVLKELENAEAISVTVHQQVEEVKPSTVVATPVAAIIPVVG